MTIASDIQQLVQAMLEPTPLAILVSVILVVTLPIALHLILNGSSSSHILPTILLLGPPGSGKTSLLTLFETGSTSNTRTSQTPLSVECSLPTGQAAASAQYRSKNDPSNLTHKKFLLADTPGHGKLRHHAISAITAKTGQNIRGIIFMVDSADLSADSESLRQTAEYLHDILLLLQKRVEKTEKQMRGMKVLVAANKGDLFTALPGALVRTTLEREIGLVRESLNKGLLDSGVDETVAEEKGWLGETGGAGFKFEQLEESGTIVTVRGGNVRGGETADVGRWWEWIGECL